MLPVLIFGLVAVLFAGWLARDVLSRDQGTPGMQDIAARIFNGANAYLNRQYSTIAKLAVVVAIVMGLLVAIFEEHNQVERGIITSIAFLIGAALSGLSGYIGMTVAVKSNVRTAAAATRGVGEALLVALRGGAVSGFLVISLGLLGISAVFWVVYIFAESAIPGVPKIAETPFWIVGFAFGASFVALFAQLGGGIYTKAADVGADLVGKVEAGIPEDDPRNPAVIADLVGDNVGDCAGMAADIFESYEVTIVSGLILGLALWHITGRLEWIIFPLMVRGIGVFSSIIGTYFVKAGKTGKSEDAMKAIFSGFVTSA